jgi:hypothetical protein
VACELIVAEPFFLRVVAQGTKRGPIRKKRVRLLCRRRQMPVIRVQIAVGGPERLVPEDALQDVDRDACVGEPGRARVAQPMESQSRHSPRSATMSFQLRRIPNGGGGEHAAARAGQKSRLRLAAVGEAFKNRGERAEDRDMLDGASLGRFGNEAPRARERLPADRDDLALPVDIADL